MKTLCNSVLQNVPPDWPMLFVLVIRMFNWVGMCAIPNLEGHGCFFYTLIGSFMLSILHFFVV